MRLTTSKESIKSSSSSKIHWKSILCGINWMIVVYVMSIIEHSIMAHVLWFIIFFVSRVNVKRFSCILFAFIQIGNVFQLKNNQKLEKKDRKIHHFKEKLSVQLAKKWHIAKIVLYIPAKIIKNSSWMTSKTIRRQTAESAIHHWIHVL